jgi:hypothetical protein
MIFINTVYGYFEKCILLVFLSPQFEKCMAQAKKKVVYHALTL